MRKPSVRLPGAALAILACVSLVPAWAALAQTPGPTPPGAGQPVHVVPPPSSATPNPAAPQASAPSPAPEPALRSEAEASANTAGPAPGEEASNRTGTAAEATPARPPARSPGATTVQVATQAALAADQTQLKTLTGVVGRLQADASGAVSDDALSRVRQEAATLQATAEAFARARAAEVAAFDQQLKLYSLKNGRPRPRLPADEARERADLLARRTEDAGLELAARQGASTASNVYNAVANRRRNAFVAHVFERTASPLEAEFWSSLAASGGPDLQRLQRLVDETGSTARQAPEPRGLASLLVALVLAATLVFPGQRLALRLIRRRAAEEDAEAPPSTPAAAHRQEAARDLGRSAYAVGRVLIDTLIPGLAAVVLNLGLTWGELITDRTEALTQAVVVATFWGAAVVALSRQLAGDPAERLLPVSERLASRMRALPWLVALITGAGFLLNRINVVVGASLAATIAADCLVALAYAAVASLVLVAIGSARGPVEAEADADVRQPGRVLVSLALSLAILLTVGAVLSGFTTFARLVSGQIFWISVLAATAYLLLRFTDDVVARLFAPRGWIGRLMMMVLNLRGAAVDQLGVLTSAVLQVVIVLGALGLALTPFGSSGDALSGHLSHFGQAVRIGSVTISPGSMGAGLASLLVGLGIVHVVERWVDRRYLPVTDWDSGVRNSVSTGVRYLGVGLAILWALAAAGLGFQQIALVASALSVGIGFGLQQIVQNFVSGLILLVERPVKVGDWVNLGAGVEGDVQRIRVRATEIRTFDRTTVIVPNSDLITKQVQNKTLGDPRGRVRLEISVGAAADAGRATEAMLDLFRRDEEVLDDPAPRVFIDSLTSGGSVNYVCFAYVSSARDTASVKSRLYAEVLDLFAREKIGFIGGPGLNYVEPGPEMKAFVQDLAGHLKAPPPPPAPEAQNGGEPLRA